MPLAYHSIAVVGEVFGHGNKISSDYLKKEENLWQLTSIPLP